MIAPKKLKNFSLASFYPQIFDGGIHVNYGGLLRPHNVDKKRECGRNIFLFTAYKFSRLRSRFLYMLRETKGHHCSLTEFDSAVHSKQNIITLNVPVNNVVFM